MPILPLRAMALVVTGQMLAKAPLADLHSCRNLVPMTTEGDSMPHKALLIMAGAMLMAGQAWGSLTYETIIDNLGATPVGYERLYPSADFGKVAQSFQVGSNTANLGSGNGLGFVVSKFQLLLEPAFGQYRNDSGQLVEGYVFTEFTLRVLPDAGGSPGSPMSSFDQYRASDTVVTPGIHTFSFVSDPFLQPETNYWIEISCVLSQEAVVWPEGHPKIYLTDSPSSAGSGSFGVSKYSTGDGWLPTGNAYISNPEALPEEWVYVYPDINRVVMSFEAETVPEPSSGVLVVLGVGAVAAYRVRRRTV